MTVSTGARSHLPFAPVQAAAAPRVATAPARGAASASGASPSPQAPRETSGSPPVASWPDASSASAAPPLPRAPANQDDGERRAPSRDPARRAVPLAALSASRDARCTPPFTIDPATGKKEWKVECL